MVGALEVVSGGGAEEVGGMAVLVSGGGSTDDGLVVGWVGRGSLVVSGGGTLVVGSWGGSEVVAGGLGTVSEGVWVGVSAGVFVGGFVAGSEGVSAGVSTGAGVSVWLGLVAGTVACRLAKLSWRFKVWKTASLVRVSASSGMEASVSCPEAWRRCPGHIIRVLPATDMRQSPSKQQTVKAMAARRPGEVLLVLG